jgi:NAD(P)-dependent dehydrogenase (short-subunit alcohol dehydrogenase family)
MQNKVWFITGASRGFGQLFVKQLLARGYRVAATSRNAKELGAATDRFLPLAMEITSEASVAAAVQATLTHFGALDVVVNNAGYGQFGTVEEATDAEARRNFDVNVFGTLNVLRATLPHLREQRSGHVFNIGSIGGYTGGFSGWGIYVATKFAISGLTESLHADLAPLGVKVTLVYPGYFRTDFLSQGSMVRPARPIAAYAAARASEAQHADAIHGNQAGDPEKAVRAMIEIYERPEAPLHLFLGSDAVAMAEAKQGEVTAAIAGLRAVSVATDFPA